MASILKSLLHNVLAFIADRYNFFYINLIFFTWSLRTFWAFFLSFMIWRIYIVFLFLWGIKILFPNLILLFQGGGFGMLVFYLFWFPDPSRSSCTISSNVFLSVVNGRPATHESTCEDLPSFLRSVVTMNTTLVLQASLSLVQSNSKGYCRLLHSTNGQGHLASALQMQFSY